MEGEIMIAVVGVALVIARLLFLKARAPGRPALSVYEVEMLTWGGCLRGPFTRRRA